MFEQTPITSFDSITWLSVQSPIKEVFVKLVKSIEQQASETQRIDQQFNHFLSERDGNSRVITGKVSDCFSCVNTKADEKTVTALRNDLLESTVQIEELRTVIRKQSDVILNLHTSLKALEVKMEKFVDKKNRDLKVHVEHLLESNTRNGPKSDILAQIAHTVFQDNAKALAAQLHSDQSNAALDLAKEMRAEMSVLYVRTKEEALENKRELRHELTRRLEPVVMAVASLESSILVQQDQLYRTTLNCSSSSSSSSNTNTFGSNVQHEVNERKNSHIKTIHSDKNGNFEIYDEQKEFEKSDTERGEYRQKEDRQKGDIERQKNQNNHDRDEEDRERERNQDEYEREKSQIGLLGALAHKLERVEVKGKQTSKICSKLLKDFSLALPTKTSEREKQYSSTFAKYNSKYEGRFKEIEEELRLALGDLGSINSRERMRIEGGIKVFCEGVKQDKETNKQLFLRIEEGLSLLGEKRREDGKKASHRMGRIEKQVEELRNTMEAFKGQSFSSNQILLTEFREDVRTVQSELQALTRLNFCAGQDSIISGRWLWTSGKLRSQLNNRNSKNVLQIDVDEGGWIHWDGQVANAAPSMLLWQQSETDKSETAATVTAVLPGLYRVCVAIFTSQPIIIQICLNGEAIITAHDSNNHYINSGNNSRNDGNNSGNIGYNGYNGNTDSMGNVGSSSTRRHRHPAGEVSSVSTEQYVSLPPNAVIGVRFNSKGREKTGVQTGVQGFLTISKL